MKYYTKKIILIYVLFFLVFFLMGCSEFSGGQTTRTTKSIIVLNNGEEISFNVTMDKQINVGVLYKQGYYLSGYYDQNEGGTMYFDSEGKSVSVWQNSFPDVFYPRWSSLSNLSFEGNDEGPFEGPKYAGQSDVGFYYDLDNKFVSGIKGNLNATLRISISFKMKVIGTSIKSVTVNVADGTGSSAETYNSSTISINTLDEYVLQNLILEVPAEIGKDGRIYILFDKQRVGTGGNYYIKDFILNISFKN